MSRQIKAQEQIAKYYKENKCDIGAVRSALGDASVICDAISADILEAVKPKTKLKLQRAKEISDAVKMAGDAIWAIREKLKP